jgi:hypothetical protein
MHLKTNHEYFEYLASKKIGSTLALLLVMVVTTSCAHTSVVAPSPSSPVDSKRFLRVALFLADEERMPPELLPAVQRAFQDFEEKTGIGIGAYTTVKVNLSGVVTQSQVYGRLREAWSPMDPGSFDIGICYAPRVYLEDVLAIVAGVVVLNSADASDGRFMVIRTLNSGMIEHELGHLFCAMDGQSPEENLKWVLANKDRRYDSRGWGMCKNLEALYPDRGPENPWSTEEYAGVVERAKTRAMNFGKMANGTQASEVALNSKNDTF